MKKILLINNKNLLPLLGILAILLPVYIITITNSSSLIAEPLITLSLSQIYRYSFCKYSVLGNIGLLIFANCMFHGIKNVVNERVDIEIMKKRILKNYKTTFLLLCLVALITVDFYWTRRIHIYLTISFFTLFIYSSILLYKGLKLSYQKSTQILTGIYLVITCFIFFVSLLYFDFDTSALFIPEVLGALLLSLWVRLSYKHSFSLRPLIKSFNK